MSLSLVKRIFGYSEQKDSEIGFKPELTRIVEEGIGVSPENLTKIQTLMPKILRVEDDPYISWLSKRSDRVFSLACEPNLIFRVSYLLSCAEEANAWFENILRAKEICLFHKLTLLIIPHAKEIEIGFEGKKIKIIASERIGFKRGKGVQENNYQTLSGLDETIKQLTTFVTFSGALVKPDHIPIVDDQKAFWMPRRVAIINFKTFGSPYGGLFDDNCGLIGCLYTEQKIDELIQFGSCSLNFLDRKLTAAKTKRMKDIENQIKLQEFYVRHGIDKEPRKPITISDLESLGLYLAEPIRRKHFLNTIFAETQQDFISMGEAIMGVVNYINSKIVSAPDDSTTKYKRLIHMHGSPFSSTISTEWLTRILRALERNEYIFSVAEAIDGYNIQA